MSIAQGSVLDNIRRKAAAQPQHIVLPEGEDPRTLQAASRGTPTR